LRHGNDSISGLTTAALLIWGEAGIDIAVGAWFYQEALFSVVLLIVSVELFPFLTIIFGPKQLREKEIILQVTVADAKDIADVIHSIKSQNIHNEPLPPTRCLEVGDFSVNMLKPYVLKLWIQTIT